MFFSLLCQNVLFLLSIPYSHGIFNFFLLKPLLAPDLLSLLILLPSDNQRSDYELTKQAAPFSWRFWFSCQHLRIGRGWIVCEGYFEPAKILFLSTNKLAVSLFLSHTQMVFWQNYEMELNLWVLSYKGNHFYQIIWNVQSFLSKFRNLRSCCYWIFHYTVFERAM